MRHNQPLPTITLVSTALDLLRIDGIPRFYTIDVIRKVLGQYLVNADTPVKESWNAEFGRVMSANAVQLGIKAMRERCKRWDDEGSETTSHEWEFID